MGGGHVGVQSGSMLSGKCALFLGYKATISGFTFDAEVWRKASNDWRSRSLCCYVMPVFGGRYWQMAKYKLHSGWYVFVIFSEPKQGKWCFKLQEFGMLSKVCSRMDERCLGECDAGPSCLSSSVLDVPVSITDEENFVYCYCQGP